MTDRPHSWANWAAHSEGKKAGCAEEYDLYSDSTIHGSSQDFGPYRLINLVAGERIETAIARPVMTLRIHHAAHANPDAKDTEHNGRHPDEVASLLSLALGIRLQAGDKSRFIDFGADADPLGRPKSQAEVMRPSMPMGYWTQVIAHARKTADIDDLAIVAKYPTLSAAKASALLRSARLYQEAVWISENDPWLTWLLLVSAVETASAFHSHDATDPVALLRELNPKLAQVCDKYGATCVADVAHTQVQLLGATKKFLTFFSEFMPNPPTVRPKEHQHPWTKETMTKSLRQIYNFRSEYLHAGVPFPWRLCQSPEPAGGAPAECLPGELGEEGSDAKVPLLQLHTFEHLVRGSLLAWWADTETAA